MFDAVILSNERIFTMIRMIFDGGKIFKFSRRAPVAVNFFKAMANRHSRHWNRVKMSVALNVTNLSTSRVENGNVDVNKRGEI